VAYQVSFSSQTKVHSSSSGDPAITLEGVSKRYGAHTALQSTTMALPPGSTTVLIGPSGCGKSTLLRIIMGLISPDTGRVLHGATPLSQETVESLRHQIGYVIQDGGLFPHLTARRNITLLAGFLHRPSSEIDARVNSLADLAQLPRELLDRYPVELSGGQRQRVGLMRALMLDPEVLLLDEPLGALDPITRFDLQAQLKSIFDQLRKTVVLVTHDMGEAAYFGGDIVLMQAGAVVQRGSLADLLERPAAPYVSQFIRAQRSPLPADAVPEASP
jgi:osmoprotectant transport system ATP-binding protein